MHYPMGTTRPHRIWLWTSSCSVALPQTSMLCRSGCLAESPSRLEPYRVLHTETSPQAASPLLSDLPLWAASEIDDRCDPSGFLCSAYRCPWGLFMFAEEESRRVNVTKCCVCCVLKTVLQLTAVQSSVISTIENRSARFSTAALAF